MAKGFYDLQALRVFLAVAASGSMTAAARRMALTQSAVSQTMRQLEETFGAVLVDRARRPLTLTAAGVALQRHALPMVDEAELLRAAVRQAASAKLPELRVGIIDSFAATVGPALIRELLAEAVRLSFRSGLAYDQTEGLLGRNLDFIVTSDPMEDVDGLERHLILTEPYVLLLPRGTRARAGVADLHALAAAHSLVRFSARSQIGAQIERRLRRLGVQAPRTLEVDATDALVAMVAAGLGWAVATPLCLLQVRSRLTGIEIVPFPAAGEGHFTRQLHLIARSGEYGALPARVAALSRDILRRDSLPAMARLLPGLKPQPAAGT